MRSIGYKLKYKNFHLTMRENFPLRVAEDWVRLPREAVGSPSPETLQTLWTVPVSPAAGDSALAGGLD